MFIDKQTWLTDEKVDFLNDVSVLKSPLHPRFSFEADNTELTTQAESPKMSSVDCILRCLDGCFERLELQQKIKFLSPLPIQIEVVKTNPLE